MMRRRAGGVTASVAALVTVVLALTTACTSAPGPAAAPSGSVPVAASADGLVEMPPQDAGVLVAAVPRAPSATRAYGAGAASTTLELRDCRLLWPGFVAFDLAWQPAADVALPAIVGLDLTVQRPDGRDSVSLDATLSAAGAFTVVTRPQDLRPASAAGGSVPASADRRATRGAIVSTLGGSCTVESVGGAMRVTSGGHGLRPAYVRPIVHAPDGTVEALLAAVDPANRDDPLLPIVGFVGREGLPAMDRWWVAPRHRIASIGVTQDAACVTVTTGYGDDTGPDGRPAPAAVTVTQRRGCAQDGQRPANDVTTIRVEDDLWDVRVTGAATGPSDLIADLVVLPFASGGEAPTTGFDPEAYLDAWFAQHPDVQEAGRAPWQGGMVGVTLRHSEIQSRPVLGVDTAEAIPGGAMNAGGSGTTCRDMGARTKGSNERGYVAVVVTGAVARVQYAEPRGSEWQDLALRDARIPGYRFGFVGDPPLPDRPNMALGVRLRYLDANGVELRCEQ